LHERVPPFPREDAMKIIEGEFDCPVSHIFSYVSDEPVAAASFGQVIASWAYLLNIMKLSSPAFLRKKNCCLCLLGQVIASWASLLVLEQVN
jgi:hypothetical protein